ncbi:uncharacterized protein LOC131055539 [Cryptomeria japonica]|uniref:uncharacterized protein LOC131055539 n=1 Tax=Cryptomeria japonica TaxID=3369 RepID=UPI0025ABB3EF|nr:uncharacterized protein LOC131055539 [Cryptomeria japonica]
MTRKRSRESKSNDDLHTQVVTTDVSKFSKIVQQLTGMPNLRPNKPENSLQLVLKPVPKKPNVEGLPTAERVIFPITTPCLQRPKPSLPVKPSFMAAENEFHLDSATSLPFSLPNEDDICSLDSEEPFPSFLVGKDNDIFSLDSEELWQVMELNTRESFMLSNIMTKV